MSQNAPIIKLVSPLTGVCVALGDVPDPVFSGGMFGDGLAVDPTENKLVAPCDGTVTHLAKTGHALTLTTFGGAEILLHVGIDTVELKGKGFKAKVAMGDVVRLGDLLIEFDADEVAQKAKSLVSVVVLANHEAFEITERTNAHRLVAGETPFITVRARSGIDPVIGEIVQDTEFRAIVRLGCKGGLHARPAARIRASVAGLKANVSLIYEGRTASVGSIVGMLGLGVGEGSAVEVAATGIDAHAALKVIRAELEKAAPEENEKKIQPLPVVAPDRDLPPNSLGGVCASAGVAVGNLVQWGEAEIAIPETAAGTTLREEATLKEAIAQVDTDLEKAIKDATRRASKNEADIFAVHRVLLEDPALLGEAKLWIAQGKSAGFAWRLAARAQIDVLSALDDPLLAERANDLKDLEKQVLRALGYSASSSTKLAEESVLLAGEFTPSDLTGLDKNVVALVMAHGGATSHAAIIARQLGIPCLVAVGDEAFGIAPGTQVIVDAGSGFLRFAPNKTDIKRARAETERLAEMRDINRETASEKALTLDDREIEVASNIATIEDALKAVENGADAVGLLRTELLFIHRPEAPTVAEHTETYEAILTALEGRKAIIRTLDVGADKEVDYLTLPPEPNPALGLRGIRLAQARPDLLEDQLRGLLAARPYGKIRILLPMVTDAVELARLRKLIDRLAEEMDRKENIEVGAMIEVPSAALLADQLAEHADFLSIGTNDLTQYALAMDRCHAGLAAQADSMHPAVLHLIARAAAGAAKHKRWIGVCGALAGEPLAVPFLIGIGITELSVDPALVPEIKARVRQLDYAACKKHAKELLKLNSPQAVRAVSAALWPVK